MTKREARMIVEDIIHELEQKYFNDSYYCLDYNEKLELQNKLIRIVLDDD